MDIFLGSSRDLFSMRTSFAALADSITDVAYDYCGVDVTARMWENESFAIERDSSKQDAYDEMIRGCDLAFFLADGHLGDYTLHEYFVAMEAFALHGKPKVVTWMRGDSSPFEASSTDAELSFDTVRDANARLLLESAIDNEDVDVRKLVNQNAVLLDMLGLILQELGPIPVQVKNGAVWTGYKRLVALDGVPLARVNAFQDGLGR